MSDLKDFVPIAEEYIERSKNRDPWVILLHGYAATHEHHSSRERGILDSMVNLYPTPDVAKKICVLYEFGKPYGWIYDTRRPTMVHAGICQAAEQWSEIKEALRTCNRDKLKELYGISDKGADMISALAGCDVPVIDRHIVRYLVPDEDDDYYKKVQTTPRLYQDLRNAMIKRARESGIRPLVFHCALWFSRVFGTPDKAKEFVDNLFGEG